MKKIDFKALFKKRKKVILCVTALVLVAAIGCSIWYYAGHTSSEPVYVYSFNYIGMTEYWGDSQESYGPVTTDKIQTIYLSDTQTVTEILVKEGDTVKKGDLLMRFDTTLSDLALERKRLDVEKLKLQLEDAEDDLAEIKSMKPMVIPDYSDFETSDEEDGNMGTALTTSYRLSDQKTYDGSTQEKALICWLNSSTAIDDDLLEVIRQRAEEFYNINAEANWREASSASVVPDGNEGGGTDGTEGSDETTAPSSEATEPSSEATEPSSEATEPSSEATEPSSEATEPSSEATEPSSEATEPSSEATEPTDAPYQPVTVNHFYVVFKVTEGNMSMGSTLVWQGMSVTKLDSGDFQFRLYNANGMIDHTLVQSGEDDGDTGVDFPEIDYGSGYTSAQIAQMRSEKEKEIKDLQFKVKMAEAEYKIMQTEVSDGNVYAEIDGEVVSVLTEEEAKQMQQPVLKVSGGGGFYVEGFVSELEKDNMQIGQEVTVNDWNTGMTYTGTVASLGDFPTSSGYWSGSGNPTASYYPFQVFVDGSADLQQGRYVSVTYSTASNENGVYLENPFIRTEGGKSYVLVLGEDGRLEQRYVTTGKSLWGSYTEILEGITPEDLIAFPYGKNVKAGVQAVEGDLSDLYG